MEILFKIVNTLLAISFITSIICSFKKDEKKKTTLKRAIHSFINGSLLATMGMLQDSPYSLIIGLVLVFSSVTLYNKTNDEIKNKKENKG